MIGIIIILSSILIVVFVWLYIFLYMKKHPYDDNVDDPFDEGSLNDEDSERYMESVKK